MEKLKGGVRGKVVIVLNAILVCYIYSQLETTGRIK